MSEMGSSMAKEVMDEYRRRSREPEAIPVVKIQEIAIDIDDYIDNIVGESLSGWRDCTDLLC